MNDLKNWQELSYELFGVTVMSYASYRMMPHNNLPLGSRILQCYFQILCSKPKKRRQGCQIVLNCFFFYVNLL